MMTSAASETRASSSEEFHRELADAIKDPPALAPGRRGASLGGRERHDRGGGRAPGEPIGFVFCARVGDHSRSQYRWVPLAPDAQGIEEGGIVDDTLTWLGKAVCTATTGRVLPEGVAGLAYRALEVARADIFDRWREATDPRNMQPAIPKPMRDAADLLRSHASREMPRERRGDLLDTIEAPYDTGTQRLRLQTLDAHGDAKGRAMAVIALVDELGLQPPPPVEPLPEIDEEDVNLVTWIALIPTHTTPNDTRVCDPLTAEASPHDYVAALLGDFARLPATVERGPTFLEIQGYPHLEDVCGNVFAFFADPEEAHGLGTLLLDALKSAGNITDAKGLRGSVSVAREVVTHTNKKIDILIISDDHAILIENKIHAPANNPFGNYAEYLDTIAGVRSKHKLLLTLYPTSAGSRWDFTNLTHETFVRHIRLALARCLPVEDNRYVTMFLDFLDTLDNLRKGTRMNTEFVKLLVERSDEIERLFTDLQRFGNELKEKVRGLQELVDASHPSVSVHTGSRGQLSRTSVHVIDVAAEDLLFRINTSISQHGWEIDFDIPRKSYYPRLRAYLERRGITFADRERYGFIYPNRFAYDEGLARVSPVVQSLVDKLAAENSEPV